MARADLIKKIFRCYKGNGSSGFMDATQSIIEEERKKNRGILAEELNRILNNGYAKQAPSQFMHYQPPPRDPDRKTPLLQIKHPDPIFLMGTSKNEVGDFQNFRCVKGWAGHRI